MRFKASGLKIQCVEKGLLIRPRSLSPSCAEAFTRVCAADGIGSDRLLNVTKVTKNGIELDSQDRVQLGALLLRDLVAAGL